MVVLLQLRLILLLLLLLLLLPRNGLAEAEEGHVLGGGRGSQVHSHRLSSQRWASRWESLRQVHLRKKTVVLNVHLSK